VLYLDGHVQHTSFEDEAPVLSGIARTFGEMAKHGS
jgi:hypothetical protein